MNKAADALDFWRVLVAARKRGRSIHHAEMKLSGQVETRGVTLIDLRSRDKLKEAGKFLEIRFLGHIIIMADYYTSFADEWLL